MTEPDRHGLLAQVREKMRAAADSGDAGFKRMFERRSGGTSRYHIATYRGLVDPEGCWLSGRVLQRALLGGPREDDNWWDNLLNTYRRFDSERMPGVAVEARFRGQSAIAVTDEDGYYQARLAVSDAPAAESWEMAEVRLGDGGPVFLQPVLCVPATARFGVISDIDDTVLESSITHWQTAAQLVFLHNAQTRKPLEGVAGLYEAFQRGPGGSARNPIFYVSASPWNLYDLLEDFFDLNGIPQGPILLRDVDVNRASFRADSASLSKLEHIHRLIERYPALNWVLMGDSGQIDADLYARTIARYPGKILAIYIRDVDPAVDSSYDKFVDGHIERVAGSGVPMLRVSDSNAIAAHAHQLGLIESAGLGRVAAEVLSDQALPPLKEAAASEAVSALADAVLPADERPSAPRPRPE